MYPISDLTAFCRKTTGDVPPKLVGASTTVVGSRMYLYGGRLVSERKMVSDIYVFDLENFKWERIAQSSDDDIPQARYFHSADTWRNHLIIFGGMAIKPQSDNPEDLCVLNDVRLFDLTNRHWLPASPTPADSSLVPNARYAHLSSVTADRLFIIGGQDLANVWLDDVYIFDLASKTWIQRRDYPRHCGTYRSVAVTADQRVRLPQDEMRGAQSSARLGQPGTRFNIDKKAPAAPNATQSEALIHLPYSASPTDDYPCDIFLFSNYNFTDVQRELEVFTPLSDGDFTVSDRSGAMTGTSFPPGLRFPTGAILGTFFIVAGTYLSQTYQSFSIWALDLINMTWSRIDPGSALASGSWFRSCLWASANKFVVFGNRHGNLVEDYNRRLLSWDHVTCIDLEAFGIYQPPPLVLDIPMQELGVAALEEGLMSDFDIICDDGRRIKVSRKLLEDRWPWFKEQRKIFLQAATRALEALPSISPNANPPDVPSANRQEQRPDPRLTARSFNLSEPYPITLAFVQYLYSMALITPLQHAPAVLSQLLLLSSTYQLTHLQSLVKHAMHRALSYATSVGIYGVSTLCSCRSLQIRALRVVMAYSQKRPTAARTKNDKDGGAGGGRNSDASGGNGGNGRLDVSSAARPRGMSDASYMRGASDNSASNSRGFARNVGDDSEPLMVLADLQEFGIPGQEVALPAGASMGSSTLSSIHSQKWFSDVSAALPPLNEDEYLDMDLVRPKPTSSPNALARQAPPTIPLPNLPAQQQSNQTKRPGSFDTLSSLDTLPDFAPIASLPVSKPRRMASSDTISSSSSRDARSDRGGMSPARGPSPGPIIRPTPRPFSIMSQSTEQDLLAIAEMLSPTVQTRVSDEEPFPEGPPMSESESFTGEENSARDSVSSNVYSLYSSYRPESSVGASHRGSTYTDSDGASYFGDDLPDPGLLAAPFQNNGLRNLHLARGSFPMPPLDDSQSLSPSTSYGSLRTPSLSRASSVAHLSSPPTSPALPYSPIDMSALFSPPMPMQNSNTKLLHTIEESMHPEEGHGHNRRTSDTTEVVHLYERSEETRPAPPSYAPPPPAYQERRQSPRCDSRGEMRGPAQSLYHSDSKSDLKSSGLRSESRTEKRSPSQPLYKSDSRGDLRGSGLRNESRTEMRSPPTSPPPVRRQPELHRLKISSSAPSLSSAPVLDISSSSPFHQHTHMPQIHSAHPATQRTQPFAPEPQSASPYWNKRSGFISNRSSTFTDDEPSPYTRERQLPFGTVSSAYSAKYTPAHTADFRSQHTSNAPASFQRTHSPTFAYPESERMVQKTESAMPPPPVPPLPVPASPVLSAASSNSSHKSIRKAVGLSKLFGKGSDRSSKKSAESSVHSSNKSMSSLDLGNSRSEEKRLKKEAAKARTERLAQDLAEKARRRAEEAKAQKGSFVKEKSKKPWEEGGGLYEGISYF